MIGVVRTRKSDDIYDIYHVEYFVEGEQREGISKKGLMASGGCETKALAHSERIGRLGTICEKQLYLKNDQ